MDEGVFASLKGKFDHVNYVNRELLRPLLSSLSETRYCRMLEAAGFTVVKKQFVYGDQAWYIVGRKDVEIDREEITVAGDEGVQETRAAAA